MQASDAGETVPGNTDGTNEVERAQESTTLMTGRSRETADYDSVLDISGKRLEFSVSDGAEDPIEGLYVYKNVFNLIPRSLGSVGGLKTLKFFANEINLFPEEFRNLVELQCLQVKISALGLTGLPLHKLKALKELELCKVPPRPSAFPILSEIAALKCLTKLAVCHFSIRYLPPEIGCLRKLEYLDLSFNKMRSLPTEITYLNALISLKVANNKLVELPCGLASLQRLENLDLSNNRLTSLECLELGSMFNLQKLNLQNNKLLSCCQIPSWINCNLEGNDKDTSNDEIVSSSVEMDVFEGFISEVDDKCSQNSSPSSSLSHLTGSSSNSRCFASRRRGKGWKRRYYLQQRARQERLNSSRKWKGDDHAADLSTQNAAENCKPCKHTFLASEALANASSRIVGSDVDSEVLLSEEAGSENLLIGVDTEISSKKEYNAENCSCASFDSVETCIKGENDGTGQEASLNSHSNSAGVQEEDPFPEGSSSNLKAKRHPDTKLENPKPSKSRRPTDGYLVLSCKYSDTSFCSIEDHLPDGFYDAGRDRPFMPLKIYEQNLHLDSREVILVDRQRDEVLDALLLRAREFVFHFKHSNGSKKEKEKVAFDNLQIASLLALFVSDHFGGSDRSAFIGRTRKAVSGSNYRKPFICTCPTGNNNSVRKFTKQSFDTVEDVVFLDLCERSLQCIKTRQNSIIVPIGTLQFGVCRHRALLLKYLCDRMEPRVPCELVRGYLDFSPHAWNTIVVKRGDSWVRMTVDACRPHDIREETDPEYFCRYIPLSRINVPLTTYTNPGPNCSFPSLSSSDEIGKSASSTLLRCKFGSTDAAVKVRSLKVCESSVDEIKNFEYTCLGEVRILSTLKKHSCIIETYGHQISSKWHQSSDGNPEHRVLQSAILMEYIKGGSLKNYIEKLSRSGDKHVPVEMALCIARDVACALAELHSKHIIHRDIKSENILVDLDRKRADGTPIVKLCDFDRAVPLHSVLHTCCIAHTGIPPPNVCVGTPRWMAPEVFQAMHKRNMYGLEVDIWSFGCLLLELLTLQVPYSGLSESNIHELLQAGKRPQLTKELEALGSFKEPTMAQSGNRQEGLEAEPETLRFLVDLFHRCTVVNPTDRPTAENLYNMLLAHKTSFTSSRSLVEE